MSEEQAPSIDLIGTMVELQAVLVHKGRKSAFAAGVFSIVLPFMVYSILDYNFFDKELGAFIEEHKWASFLTIGVFTACWKGMKYLAVTRHDPERKKK